VRCGSDPVNLGAQINGAWRGPDGFHENHRPLHARLFYGAASHLWHCDEGGVVEQPRTALAERIAEQRAGLGDPRALVGEMRRSWRVVVWWEGGLWSAHAGGVRWVCLCADEADQARFAEQRGITERALDYAALLGAQIVDEIVPGLGEPAGLAVDIPTEDGSMFFPPVTGIVPDEDAVDAVDAGSDGEGGGRGR